MDSDGPERKKIIVSLSNLNRLLHETAEMYFDHRQIVEIDEDLNTDPFESVRGSLFRVFSYFVNHQIEIGAFLPQQLNKLNAVFHQMVEHWWKLSVWVKSQSLSGTEMAVLDTFEIKSDEDIIEFANMLGFSTHRNEENEIIEDPTMTKFDYIFGTQWYHFSLLDHNVITFFEHRMIQLLDHIKEVHRNIPLDVVTLNNEIQLDYENMFKIMKDILDIYIDVRADCNMPVNSVNLTDEDNGSMFVFLHWNYSRQWAVWNIQQAQDLFMPVIIRIKQAISDLDQYLEGNAAADPIIEEAFGALWLNLNESALEGGLSKIFEKLTLLNKVMWNIMKLYRNREANLILLYKQ